MLWGRAGWLASARARDMPVECNIGEAAGHSITGSLPRSNWMPSEGWFGGGFALCAVCVCCFFFFLQANRAPAVLGPGSWKMVFVRGTFLQEYPCGLLDCEVVAFDRTNGVWVEQSFLPLPLHIRQSCSPACWLCWGRSKEGTELKDATAVPLSPKTLPSKQERFLF